MGASSETNGKTLFELPRTVARLRQPQIMYFVRRVRIWYCALSVTKIKYSWSRVLSTTCPPLIHPRVEYSWSRVPSTTCPPPLHPRVEYSRSSVFSTTCPRMLLKSPFVVPPARNSIFHCKIARWDVTLDGTSMIYLLDHLTSVFTRDCARIQFVQEKHM